VHQLSVATVLGVAIKLLFSVYKRKEARSPAREDVMRTLEIAVIKKNDSERLPNLLSSENRLREDKKLKTWSPENDSDLGLAMTKKLRRREIDPHHAYTAPTPEVAPKRFRVISPKAAAKALYTCFALFVMFVLLNKSIWNGEQVDEDSDVDLPSVVAYRALVWTVEIPSLHVFYCFLNRRFSTWFGDSAGQQAHNIVTICVKIPVMLHCLIDSQSWRNSLTAVDYLATADFATTYWHHLILAGFYLWEVLVDDLKPAALVHHLTSVFCVYSTVEWVPNAAVGQLMRRLLPVCSLIATGGALTVCLPMFLCGLNLTEKRKSLILYGASAVFAVYYVLTDFFAISSHFIYARQVEDVPWLILYMPPSALIGIMPLQLMCFSFLRTSARQAWKDSKRMHVPTARTLRRTKSE